METTLKYPALIGAVRERLTADRTYYVRTDGSDANNGLSNTAGGAFLTIQKAINTISTLDIATYNVTIQVADGTYTGTVVVNGPWLGSGTVTLQGNASTPANVVISSTNTSAITVKNAGALTVKDLKITTSGTPGYALVASANAAITFQNINFGACGQSHVRAEDGGAVTGIGSYTISGAAQYHFNATAAIIRMTNAAATLSGTPAFSNAFALAQMAGVLIIGSTYSGSATGKRYDVLGNGVIFTNGGGANYFPGSVAGTAASGGQYL